jgi:5-histidylcysteine sulfoxide synthase/putative 4-mercaptohistidine N1-methyltranferase
MLTGTDPDTTRRIIGNYFHATFDRYDKLFETLSSDEAYFIKPITLRHPLIFYLGHTATFFVNKLTLAGLVESRINPKFESIFAIGVDEMSWDDLNEAHYEWPAVHEVRAYRNKVREVVSKVIRTTPLTLPIDWNSPWWAIMMGIEHELIHLETSSVLIRQHQLQYVKSHEDWQPCRQSGPAPANELVPVEAGMVKLGKDKTDPFYGWDNEYGHHEAVVPGFEAGRYLVSNQEFLGFVESGGYGNFKFWQEEGKAWKEFTNATHPAFWIKSAAGWKLRLMTEEVPMPWDWPVEVNYHEAKAFCNWKKAETGQPYRLPTEDEWHRLHNVSGAGNVPADLPATANIHLDHFASSCPVTTFRQGDFFDVTGNVWQWTETPIYPFEGFEVHPWYDDFSTPTFDGRHNLITGGSWISCGNESLQSSRYAFRRHFFQHAGFRYVVSNGSTTVPSSQYETDKLLSEYAEFHYGDDYFGVKNFSKSLVDLAVKAMGIRPAHKALDIGCAAGRAAFELARHFDHVDGVDFSARFIGLGVKLAEQGVLRYALADEGELVFYRERKLADFGLDSVRNKVLFSQGDACNLKPIHTGYDLILAANLIDRLYNPKKFLTTVHERLNPGGILLIASPYTWMEEHTKREEWIGGFKKNGESVTTFDGLNALLGPRFKLVEGPIEVPFVIRETRRKFQHTISEVTIWERTV